MTREDQNLFFRMWHTAFVNNADRSVTIRGWLSRLRGPAKVKIFTSASILTPGHTTLVTIGATGGSGGGGTASAMCSGGSGGSAQSYYMVRKI